MIVDILLRLLGENPAGYPRMTDKLSIIFIDFWASSFFWLPIILFVMPWLWLIWNKKHGGKMTKKRVVITVFVSALLIWLGYNIPWWIIEIMGGMTVQGIYGGQV